MQCLRWEESDGEFKTDEDVPMMDASPSPFILDMDMDMDMKSALDDLRFTGRQQTVLPQVTKSRFEPKLKARPQVRGRESQLQSKVAFKPGPAPQLPEGPLPAVKQETEMEFSVVLTSLPQTKPEPIQDHGFLDFDFSFPVKNDLPIDEGPKVEVKVAGTIFPDLVTKKEEVVDDSPDDGGDRVVREIDVYLRPKLDGQTELYLLQYPLRPSWRPYGLEDRCEQVRVKSQQKKLEIDLAVDTGGENYDVDAPDYLKIKNQTLISSRTPLSTSYAVGILQGNQLHLNPLHAIVQLRPSMRYLDEAECSIKKSSGSPDADEKMRDGEGEPAEENPDLVAMQVTVRRRETERQEEMRLHSYEYLKKLDAAEPWITLEPHGMDSPVTVDVRQRMKSCGVSAIPFEMPLKEYIKTLVPGRPGAVAVEALSGDAVGNAGLSRSFLDTLGLNDRFQVLLSRGRVHVLQFDRLMKLAPPGCSEQEVLDVLKGIALLVQGCWVAPSMLRYSGPITVVRDYILLLFSKSRVVHHNQLDELRVPKEMLREVLLSLAVQRGAAAGWEFQESTDKSFLKRHQAVAKEKAQLWAAVEPDIIAHAMKLNISSMDEVQNKVVQVPLPSLSEGKAAQVSTSAAPWPQRVAPSVPKGMPKEKEKLVDSNRGLTHVSEVGELSGRSTMSGDTIAALPGALLEIFSKHSVCSLQFICHSLREMAITKSQSSSNPKAAAAAVAAAQGANAPLPELAAVVNRVASNIDGVYFLSSLSNPQVDPFRECVIQLLRSKGASGSGLRRTDVMEASKIVCNRECPAPIYSKVMADHEGAVLQQRRHVGAETGRWKAHLTCSAEAVKYLGYMQPILRQPESFIA